MAALTVGQVKFEKGSDCGVAAVKVLASKRDTKAEGVTRRHGCACPSPLCPQTAKEFKESRIGAAENEPLVTSKQGAGVTKAEMMCDLRGYAAWLGDDVETISGHSMRVTGAQL